MGFETMPIQAGDNLQEVVPTETEAEKTKRLFEFWGKRDPRVQREVRGQDEEVFAHYLGKLESAATKTGKMTLEQISKYIGSLKELHALFQENPNWEKEIGGRLKAEERKNSHPWAQKGDEGSVPGGTPNKGWLEEEGLELEKAGVVIESFTSTAEFRILETGGQKIEYTILGEPSEDPLADKLGRVFRGWEKAEKLVKTLGEQTRNKLRLPTREEGEALLDELKAPYEKEKSDLAILTCERRGEDYGSLIFLKTDTGEKTYDDHLLSNTGQLIMPKTTFLIIGVKENQS